MPYIKKRRRVEIDKHLDPLISEMVDTGAHETILDPGEVNYVVTRLMQACAEQNYASFALTTGTVRAAVDEFYRRRVAPYEDKKIEENGDVYW